MGANESPACIGQSVRRKEDARFLTGAGQYTDDVTMPRQTHAYFLRSPHAHARIRGDRHRRRRRRRPASSRSSPAPTSTGVNGLPCGWLITSTDGKPMKEPPHPVLAQGKVRYVGDQVALVVAETLDQAKDAAELIDVDYEVLPAVVNAVDALKPGAPQIHDEAPGNKCYTWALGDKAAVDAAFAKAAHVTKIDIVNNRLIPNAIEPRAAVASYNRADDAYTLYVTSQNPHVERLLMTAFVLGLPEHKVRVIAPDVGGGFGSKIYLYAEETAMVWASKRVNRPIKWAAERSESFLSDAHGRDHVTHAELALDKDGKFLALRVHTTANMGAYLSTFASCIPTILYATLLAGPVHDAGDLLRSDGGVHQHRAGRRVSRRGPARGDVRRRAHRAPGGRRDWASPQDEMRRRNFIRTFPVPDAGRAAYDTGDYDATLDEAMKMADVAGFAARKAEAAKRGKLRGLGYASYIEACGIAPSNIAGALGARAGLFEAGEVRVHPTGSVTVFTGSHSHGQGHETTFAQVVATRLGMPVENVDVVHGDTGRVPFGMGTYGSRSLVGRRHGDRQGARQDRRQGQEDRRAPARGGGDRHRVQGRQVHRRRHRPQQDVRRDRAHRVRAAQLSARQARAGPRTRRRSTIRRTSRSRPARTSARSRSIPTPASCRSSAFSGVRRLRQHHQSDDRRGPGARRRRAGHRPGAARALRLRRGERPAPDRQLHGLRDAARRRRAVVQGRHQGHAVHAQSARRQGLRRGRRDRRAGGGDERGARRAGAASASSTSTCRRRRIACGRRSASAKANA